MEESPDTVPQKSAHHNAAPWVVLAAIVVVVGIAWYAYSAGMLGARRGASAPHIIAYGGFGNPPRVGIFALSPGEPVASATPLYIPKAAGVFTQPALSPDGKSVLGVVFGFDGVESLIDAPITTAGTATTIATTSDGFFASPVWNAKGNQLAYLTYASSGAGQAVPLRMPGAPATTTFYGSVTVENTDGSARHTYPLVLLPVGFSPDGSMLLTQSGSGLMMLDLSGTAPRPLPVSGAGAVTASSSVALSSSGALAVSEAGKVVVGSVDWQAHAFSPEASINAVAENLAWRGQNLLIQSPEVLTEYMFEGNGVATAAASTSTVYPRGTQVLSWK